MGETLFEFVELMTLGRTGTASGQKYWIVRRSAGRAAAGAVRASHAVNVLCTVRWKGSEGSKQMKHTTRKLTPC